MRMESSGLDCAGCSVFLLSAPGLNDSQVGCTAFEQNCGTTSFTAIQRD